MNNKNSQAKNLKTNFLCIGQGAWGQALCHILQNSEKKQDINLSIWTRSLGTENLEKLLKKANIIILAIPTQAISDFIDNIKNLDSIDNISSKKWLIASKGIDIKNNMLISDVIVSKLNLLNSMNIAVLSGPNFAHEILNNMPSATTIASANLEYANYLCHYFSCSFFRPYSLEDIKGVQFCAAVKNILALACGIAIGKGFAENTKAMLITRGLAEIKRFFISANFNENTIMSLAGIGDIILTTSSLQSRNTKFGYDIGSGKSKDEAIKNAKGVVEGLYSSAALVNFISNYNISMPICESVHKIVNHDADIDKVINNLMSRELKPEF